MKRYISILLFMLLSSAVFAQMRSVRGRVIDKEGVTLVSVSVYETGNPKNIALTDVNGVFTIKVPLNSQKLSFSSVGYVKKTITLTAGQDANVTLESDNSNLDEVVVVGLTTQKKITNTGSVSTVTGKEIRQSPAASIQNSLVGRLPGLFQQQTSGQPGKDAANIYIRGISSYATGAVNRPLVIVDDVEYMYEQLNQISSNEVESISILKDASSTAIYGVKGANGVIIITTRRGVSGTPKITLRTDFGLQLPTIRRKILPTFDALTLLKEQAVNSGQDPNLAYPGLMTPEALEHFRLGDDPYHYPSVNWYDEVMRKSTIQQSNNIDINGGTKTLRYFVSLGSLFQNGLLKEVPKQESFNNNYYLKRYNIRSNVDIDVTKTLTLKLDLSARFNEINEPNLPDVVPGGALPFWRRISSGILAPWKYPVKNEDGSYGGKKGESLNPVGLLEYGGYERTYSNDLNLNLNAVQKLDFVTQGLSFRGILAYTNNFSFRRGLTRGRFPVYDHIAGSDALDPVFPDLMRLEPLTVSTAFDANKIPYPFRRLNLQGILSYNRQFSQHNVYGLVLTNRSTEISGASAPGNFQGYALRMGYNFASKYLFEVNAGYNGSDRFQAKNRFGLFPAISLGWNLSEEKFFKKALPFINYMKLRGSWGIVGSDDVGGYRYIYEEVYTSADKNSYYFGDNNTTVPGIVPGQLANEDVRWEKERKIDIGTDIKMFNSKLELTLDYFDHRRSDILTVRETVPAYSGLSLPPVNIGVVSNKGFEAEITHRHSINENFQYFVKGNISFAKNKILYRDEPLNAANPLLMRTGRPIGQIYGYTSNGFYRDDADVANSPKVIGKVVQPGDIKMVDINNDGKIDQGDIGPIGYPNIPQINYGFSLGTSYKNFDISVLFQGAARGSLNASTMLQIGTVNGLPSAIHEKRWTPETKDIAEYPRLGGVNFDASTFWLRSTNYLRLKNVELGYRLPESLVKRVRLSNVRIYANALNLITWFNLSIYDIDPESVTGTVEGYQNYPQQKVVNFGVQVGF
ncbi:TonB-dependent receptor [Pedobacter nutrimenti]|uniref:SusC/RagA family TonB-linked outer membrane protein n=1 Tax=Pedobacter nutrimenti TaxID=1241337 RepID=UPI00292F77FC|nr:TonB-dependent receptor [Pedobacter nutrimenti]